MADRGGGRWLGGGTFLFHAALCWTLTIRSYKDGDGVCAEENHSLLGL